MLLCRPQTGSDKWRFELRHFRWPGVTLKARYIIWSFLKYDFSYGSAAVDKISNDKARPGFFFGSGASCLYLSCMFVKLGPASMEAYCRSKVADGRYSFPCPDPNCNKIWEFSLVRHVACLDSETRKQIEKKVTDNYIRQGFRNQQCPGCQTWCIPIDEGDICVRCPVCSKNKGRPYDFCWACKQQWKGTGVRYCGNKGCDGKDPRIKVLHSAA